MSEPPDVAVPPAVATVTVAMEFPTAPMVQVIVVLVALITVQATPLMVTVMPEISVGEFVPVMVKVFTGGGNGGAETADGRGRTAATAIDTLIA